MMILNGRRDKIVPESAQVTVSVADHSRLGGEEGGAARKTKNPARP
jgi:hypothetical protein